MDILGKFISTVILLKTIILGNQTRCNKSRSELDALIESTNKRQNETLKKWTCEVYSVFDSLTIEWDGIIGQYRQMLAIVRETNTVAKRIMETMYNFVEQLRRLLGLYGRFFQWENTLSVKFIHKKLCQFLVTKILTDLKHPRRKNWLGTEIKVGEKYINVYIKINGDDKETFMPKVVKIIWPLDVIQFLMNCTSRELCILKGSIEELHSTLIGILSDDPTLYLTVYNKIVSSKTRPTLRSTDSGVCIQIRTVPIIDAKIKTKRSPVGKTSSQLESPTVTKNTPPLISKSQRSNQQPFILSFKKVDVGWTLIVLEEEPMETALLPTELNLNGGFLDNVTNASTLKEKLEMIQPSLKYSPYSKRSAVSPDPFEFGIGADMSNDDQPTTSGTSQMEQSFQSVKRNKPLKRSKGRNNVKHPCTRMMGASYRVPSTDSFKNIQTKEVVEEEEEEDGRLYCICQQEAYGSMIACDYPSCPIEWFHFPCAGVKIAPNNNWYCFACRRKMENEKHAKKY